MATVKRSGGRRRVYATPALADRPGFDSVWGLGINPGSEVSLELIPVRPEVFQQQVPGQCFTPGQCGQERAEATSQGPRLAAQQIAHPKQAQAVVEKDPLRGIESLAVELRELLE